MIPSRPSLKRHLTGILILVAAVPIIVFGFFLNTLLGDIVKKEVEKKNLVIARTFASDVQHFLEKQAHEIEEIHELIHVKKIISAGDANEFLETIRKTQKAFSMILLLDKDGKVEHVAPYSSDYVGIDMSGQPFFRDTRHFFTPVWSPTSISLQTGEPSTMLVLQDGDHTIAVYIDLSALKELSGRIMIGASGYAGIADQEGKLIAHRNWNLVRQQVSIRGTDFFRQATEQETGVYRTRFDGPAEITSAVMLPEAGWIVFVSEPEGQAYSHMRTIRHFITGATLLTVAVAIFLSFKLLRRVLDSLARLTTMTRHVAHGDYRPQSYTDSSGSTYKELGDLADDFLAMLEAVRDRQKKLGESEERYRSLFEESLYGLVIVSYDGTFIDVNRSFVRMLGYEDRDELLGRNIGELYVDPEVRTRLVSAITEQGYINDAETAFRRKNNSVMAVLISSTAYYGSNGAVEGFRTTVRDITEQRNLEAQLRQAQKMEAVGHLAGGVAHDFNNILTAIIGYGNLLKMKIPASDPLMSYVDQVLASGERAADLTRSLLAFSRKQVINPKPTDLNAVLRGVEKLLRRLVPEHIEFKTITPVRTLSAMVDQGQIEQVLMNLVSNARDAMPDGGLLSIETGRLNVSSNDAAFHFIDLPGDYAVITVADTGIGMDEQTKTNIFEPFFTTKEVGKGTGLGLAMVYGIIKQHNGYINVYSEPDIGTTFRIYLPLVPSDNGTEAGSADDTPPPGGNETVLIAEDDRAVRGLMKHALEEAGYSVIEAGDGMEAARFFEREQQRIGLVLLDVIMPRLNGRETYDRIRGIRSDVKVLFMSGYTDDIIHRHGVLDEGLQFIAKPVTPAGLLKKVREVLDR